MYTSGPSTFEGKTYKLHPKSKEKKSQKTYDNRHVFTSPKVNASGKSSQHSGYSGKTHHYENKPFEYKYMNPKKEMMTTSEYATKMQSPVVNITSPTTFDHRSKVKNMKNSTKINKNAGLMEYGSPKRPLHIIQENALSYASGK